MCIYIHTYMYLTNLEKNINETACAGIHASCKLSAVSWSEFFLGGALKSEQEMRCDYIIA